MGKNLRKCKVPRTWSDIVWYVLIWFGKFLERFLIWFISRGCFWFLRYVLAYINCCVSLWVIRGKPFFSWLRLYEEEYYCWTVWVLFYWFREANTQWVFYMIFDMLVINLFQYLNFTFSIHEGSNFIHNYAANILELVRICH